MEKSQVSVAAVGQFPPPKKNTRPFARSRGTSVLLFALLHWGLAIASVLMLFLQSKISLTTN